MNSATQKCLPFELTSYASLTSLKRFSALFGSSLFLSGCHLSACGCAGSGRKYPRQSRFARKDQ